MRFSDYKTVKETAEEWGVTERWVLMYCNAGRIPGAIRPARDWFIPCATAKPADGRRNNHRWPKKEGQAHE
ncbi:MAG: helix-turn-helix domain-containing protein [Oscillospiraceae bacterium]|nr:helix-turn-helix domain-containing protein [Oscillospiraceae bacterium]